MNRKLNKKGFTLIEVVLVLAIGGLIFLLAFLAFQQVSANRRDTQRRSDGARIASELQNYFADKRALPTPDAAAVSDLCAGTPVANSFHAFIDQYMCTNGTTFKSPSGPNYKGNTVAEFIYSPGVVTTDSMIYLPGYNCDFVPTGPEQAVIVMILEKGTACRSV